MEAKDANRIIYDAETGAKTGELYSGDRIYRGKAIDYLKNTVEICRGEPYFKVFQRPMFELSGALTGAEMQMVFYLAQYIGYDSGILFMPGGRPLSRQFISGETGLSVKTIDKILQGLHKKQVIGKHNNGREVHFTVNPFLFMRGKRINRTLYELFKNSRWAKVAELKRGE